MRLITPFIFAPALLLAACGDSDQQAQNNSSTSQQAATTPSQPATPPQAANPAQPPNTPDTTATIPRAPAPAAGAGNLPASAPGIGAAPIQGRSFRTETGTLQFAADNRFTWRDQAGKTLTGRYVQEAERISFNDVQGAEAGASMPMTCRYRMLDPNRMVIEDSGTTCAIFRGMTFEAQAT